MIDLKIVNEILTAFRNDIRNLLEKRLELFSLQAAEAVAEVVAGLVPKIIGGLFAAVAATMLTFALSQFLNEVFDSTYLGYLSVGGGMLLLALPLLVAKKAVWNRSIRDSVIAQITASMDPEKPATKSETNSSESPQQPLLNDVQDSTDSTSTSNLASKNVQKSQ